MKPDWTNQTVLVVCTGPTLDIPAVQASHLPKIAVNTAYTVVPDADVQYAGDALFWRVHHARMRMANNDRPPRSNVIDVLHIIFVPKIWAFSSFDKARCAAHGTKSAHG